MLITHPDDGLLAFVLCPPCPVRRVACHYVVYSPFCAALYQGYLCCVVVSLRKKKGEHGNCCAGCRRVESGTHKTQGHKKQDHNKIRPDSQTDSSQSVNATDSRPIRRRLIDEMRRKQKKHTKPDPLAASISCILYRCY